MANEQEKIILQADLYDNRLTEEEGDYTARLRISGSLRNSHIAQRILDRGSEFRKETIEHILNMADQEKIKALIQGKSVVDGMGQSMIQIRGNFGGESAPFDTSKHSLIISYTPSKALRGDMSRIAIQTNKATTGPVINSVYNPFDKEYMTITPSMPLIISGSNLKISETEGAGVYFVTEDGKTSSITSLLTHNNPSELTAMAPALVDGLYYVEVRTQSAGGSKLLKEMRTCRYPILLTVGGRESEKPDEI